MINRYLSDVGHLRSHHWKYWADVYKNCGFDCKYCVYRVGEKMGKISQAIDSGNAFRQLLGDIRPDGILYLGPKADIYQPRDDATGLTREVMKELCERRFPLFIVTRSPLVLRDMDIAQEMAAAGLIEISITLASSTEANTLEPNTPSVLRRLDLIRTLRLAGIPVSVHMSPIVPYLDTVDDLKSLMQACVDAGVDCIYACVLGMSSAYADLVQRSVAAFRPNIDVLSAYASADRQRDVYSADAAYIVPLMDELRDYAESRAIPFACVHLPEYDTQERNGGIFRFKIPTVGDMCRHFVRRGARRISWGDLYAYLVRYEAVDQLVFDAVERFWDEGQLFKNTYFHPASDEAGVRTYERRENIDFSITNMKVGSSRSVAIRV